MGPNFSFRLNLDDNRITRKLKIFILLCIYALKSPLKPNSEIFYIKVILGAGGEGSTLDSFVKIWLCLQKIFVKYIEGPNKTIFWVFKMPSGCLQGQNLSVSIIGIQFFFTKITQKIIVSYILVLHNPHPPFLTPPQTTERCTPAWPQRQQ